MTGPPDSGYDIAFGTYEEARALVGSVTAPRTSPHEVNVSMIRQFAALVRDPNPSYWDEDFARRRWGGVIAPPAMLMTWLMPLEWEPGGAVPVPLLTARVPLPGATFVNVSNQATFFEPVRVGDRLSVDEELTDVSSAKRTSLGVGHFVTTVSTYRRQDGTVLARTPNVLYRFDPDPDPDPDADADADPDPGPFVEAEPGSGEEVAAEAAGDADAAGDGAWDLSAGWARRFDDVTEGEVLAHVEDPISYRRVIMTPGATLDYFPGHHDPAYARAQGQPTIYLNTLHLLGFVDRLATAWGGPGSFVAARTLSVRRSVYAGDTMVGDGTVVRRFLAPNGRQSVELAITVTNQHGQLCAPATVELELPGQSSASAKT